jgi:hypothetical protein
MEYGRVWQECKEVDELSGYTSAEYAVIVVNMTLPEF